MPILKKSDLAGSSSTSNAIDKNLEKRASFSVTDNLQEGTNIIRVNKHKDENVIDVYIGFIQVFHRYGIKFSFSLPGFGNSITYKTEYAQLVVKKVAIKDSIVTMSLEYLPAEEKVGSIIETLTVGNDKGDMEMVLFLHMEVLGNIILNFHKQSFDI